MEILDTIYGEMTFPGRSALRAIRVSGIFSKKAARKFFDASNILLKKPKTAVRGKLIDYKKKPIDDIVCIFFKKPNSYTGEDVVEFHCHGAEGVIRVLSKSLESLGIRKARSGEFSYRAFVNGKLSLKEANRLKKIMESQTAIEAEAAFASQDLLEKEILTFREELIELLALWEARIDFPEEVPQKEICGWRKEVEPLLKRAERLYEISQRTKQIKDGFRVAIFGAPNSGKSSLFNNLLGRERAIVTPHPGTTRDILEEKLEIEGMPIVFLDMAGARKNSQKIEKAGIEKAVRVAKEADLILFLFDGRKGWRKSDEEALTLLSGRTIFKIATKKDLYMEKSFPKDIYQISNKNGEGIDTLIREISRFFRKRIPKSHFLVLNDIEMEAIREIYNYATSAFKAIAKKREHFAADFLKRALFVIDNYFREDSLEDIYDAIFKDFCIGK